jgi:hypothetical protein
MTIRRSREELIRPEPESGSVPSRSVIASHARRRRVRIGVVAAIIATLGLVGGGVAFASTSASASNGSGHHGHPAAPGPAHSSVKPTDPPSHPAWTASSGGPATPKRQPGKPTSTSSGPGHLVLKPAPRLVGSVKSTAAGQIVIVDWQGFSRTIKVTSSTVYKNSLTASVAAGTKIEAIGSVDADGTSLDATVVAKFVTGHIPSSHGPHGGWPAQPSQPATTSSASPRAPR